MDALVNIDCGRLVICENLSLADVRLKLRTPLEENLINKCNSEKYVDTCLTVDNAMN